MRRRLVVLALLAAWAAPALAVVPAGRKAPPFSAYDVTGNTVWAQRYFGRRNILLSFDSTLSGTGIRGLAEVEKVRAPFPEQDLLLVSVNVDGSPAATVRATFLVGLPGAKPLLLADDSWAIARLYGVETIPTRLLIDNTGTVRHVSEGGGPAADSALARAVASLLSGSAPAGPPDDTGGSGFRLFAPNTFTKTRADGITVAGSAPDEAKVTVRLNGGAPRTVPVKDGVFYPRIPLQLARNILEVEMEEPGGRRSTHTIGLFREAESGTGIVADIPAYHFHTDRNEAGCVDCHTMRPKVEEAVGTDPSTNPCLSCHREMGERKVVHGPIAIGGCSSCHDFQGKEHRYDRPAEGAELCFGCHDEERKAFTRSHRHEPAADGSCTACHDPHGSSEKFVLRRYVADLCFGCHNDAESAASAVSVHEPFRNGRCDQCHLPHGSDRPDAFLKVEPARFCQSCHESVEAGGHLHFFRGKAKMTLPEDVALDNAGNFTCLSCHDPHEATGKKLLRGAGCDRCHKSGG